MENSAMNDQHQPGPSHFVILVVGALTLIFSYNSFFPQPKYHIPKVESRQRNVIIVDDRVKKEIVEEISMDSISMEVVNLNESVPVFDDSVYFETLLSIDDPDRKKGLVIRYYAKPKDSEKVYALRQFGYYIHERPIDGQYEKFASNAICYGDSVKPEEVRRVAYILIKNDFKLQNISLSKYHDDWKNHAIEIGTDTTVIKEPVISLAELRNKRFD